MGIGRCCWKRWAVLDRSWAPAIGWRTGWHSARRRDAAGWIAITLTQAGTPGGMATSETPKAGTDLHHPTLQPCLKRAMPFGPIDTTSLFILVCIWGWRSARCVGEPKAPGKSGNACQGDVGGCWHLSAS